MNILEAGSFVGILVGAGVAYHFVSPQYGVLLGTLAVVPGAAIGYFIGIIIAFLFLLLLTGAVKLIWFISERLKR